MYRLEKQTEPNVAVDLDSTLETQSTLEFCLVRENSELEYSGLESTMTAHTWGQLHSLIMFSCQMQFCLLSLLPTTGSRGEESSEEDPPIDITTVQDMLSSHHYKSFKVSMIQKLRFTTDVQLGKSNAT